MVSPELLQPIFFVEEGCDYGMNGPIGDIGFLFDDIKTAVV